jgi:hypothetical protein
LNNTGKILIGIGTATALLVAVPLISSAMKDLAVGDKLTLDFESLNMNFKKLSLNSLPGTLRLKASNPLDKEAVIESVFLNVLIDDTKLCSIVKQNNGNPLKVAPGAQQNFDFNFNVNPLNFLYKSSDLVAQFIATKKFNLPNEATIKGTLTFNGHTVDYEKIVPLKKV